MVEIIKIDPSEIPIGGHKTRPEYDAVRTLEVGEAIKFPCTWKHNKSGYCSGVLGIRSAMGKAKPVKPICRDGWVYVHRIGEVDDAKA
jgi:hypothetical protein